MGFYAVACGNEYYKGDGKYDPDAFYALRINSRSEAERAAQALNSQGYCNRQNRAVYVTIGESAVTDKVSGMISSSASFTISDTPSETERATASESQRVDPNQKAFDPNKPVEFIASALRVEELEDKVILRPVLLNSQEAGGCEIKFVLGLPTCENKGCGGVCYPTKDNSGNWYCKCEN